MDTCKVDTDVILFAHSSTLNFLSKVQRDLVPGCVSQVNIKQLPPYHALLSQKYLYHLRGLYRRDMRSYIAKVSRLLRLLPLPEKIHVFAGIQNNNAPIPASDRSADERNTRFSRGGGEYQAGFSVIERIHDSIVSREHIIGIFRCYKIANRSNRNTWVYKPHAFSRAFGLMPAKRLFGGQKLTVQIGNRENIPVDSGDMPDSDPPQEFYYVSAKPAAAGNEYAL